MANDAIDLDSVRIRYDPRDGAFRLTSADPRLRGKPFMLTLSQESRAVASLLDLFQAEGIIQQGDLLPLKVDPREQNRYDGFLDEYAIAGKTRPHRDTRLLFFAGLASRTEAVKIDLGYAPHTLITGAPGSGKSELLRALTRQALSTESTVLLMDPKDSEISQGIAGLQPATLGSSRVARGIPEAERMAKAMLNEYRLRLKKLHRSNAMGSADYESYHGPMEPIFLLIDSLDHFNSLDWLSEILGHGQSVGIYILATARSAFSLPQLEDDSLLLNFGRRISMGVPSNPQEDEGISNRLLANPGRGVLRTYGSRPTVVQFVQTH